MNKGLVGGLAFIVGAALGSVVTWKLVQKKYAKEAEEEIDQMRAFYQEKKEKNEKKSRTNPTPEEAAYSLKRIDEEYRRQAARRATDIALREGYKQRSEETDFDAVAYLIDEDTFYEDDDYTKIEWTYYADGVLADENEDPIKTKDIEETIGMELLGHFGDNEEIYVRNDRFKTLYLINKDKRRYEDVYGEV